MPLFHSDSPISSPGRRAPELLAPAGSIEAFQAGFAAGADAFYLGASDFNARKRAKNLTPDEIRLVTGFAHEHKKKVYVTLNTLVHDREMERLFDLLDILDEVGINGVIVQDWGVIAVLRDFYPRIPIHASTQMFAHNSAHARFLWDNGVSRIILPRELTLDEIAAIMHEAPGEYEVFIHGAMCFSFSGCCRCSSYLYGESGNRGECRQVCRFPFRGVDAGEHPLSMRDLNTTPSLAALLDLHPASLKIEGRLRNTAYVQKTVAAYRALIDTWSAGDDPDPEHHRPVTLRDSHDGYLTTGPRYDALVNSAASGAGGERVGTVRSIEGDRITFMTDRPLSKGTKLRILDARGANVAEGTLLSFGRGATKNEIVWRPGAPQTTRRFAEPLVVYRMGMTSPGKSSGELRRANPAPLHDAALDIAVSAGTVTVTAHIDHPPLRHERSYPVTLAPARTHGLSTDALVSEFSRTDRHPLTITGVHARIDGELFCPLSVLKDIRRDFHQSLADAIAAAWAGHVQVRRMTMTGWLARLHTQFASAIPPVHFRYAGGPPLDDTPVESAFTLHEAGLDGDPPAPATDIVLLPPLFVSEGKTGAWQDRIRALAERGHRRFVAPTFGWLDIMRGIPAIEIIAGPYFHAINTPAIACLCDRGVTAFIPSPDIESPALGDVAGYGMVLHALNPPVEMFVTRLAPPWDAIEGAGIRLTARRYDEYTVIEDVHGSTNGRDRRRTRHAARKRHQP